MKLKETFKIILIIILSFTAYHLLFLYFGPIKKSLDTFTKIGLVSYVVTYLLIGIPLFIGTYLICRKPNVFRSLGLCGNILSAIGLSLLFTLPMFIGGFSFFKFNPQIEVDSLVAGTIVAGFMEELYFRGFLFGLLFRKTKLGFIPSIVFGALLFASGHLYQSQDFRELIGIFLITFSGAVLFAWLYVEWNYNLWVPICTHTFMNLSWNLFEVDNSALGDLTANISRGLTIFLAIVFTIVFKKRNNQKVIINRNTLFIKREFSES